MCRVSGRCMGEGKTHKCCYWMDTTKMSARTTFIKNTTAEWSENAPQIDNRFTVRKHGWVFFFFIIETCVADNAVSWGADAGYSTADRATDRSQNRLTVTFLFSSFLWSKLLFWKRLLSTLLRLSCTEVSGKTCLMCRKSTRGREEVWGLNKDAEGRVPKREKRKKSFVKFVLRRLLRS